MMYEPEKSDPYIRAMKPASNCGLRRRSWWSEGRGPRFTALLHHVSVDLLRPARVLEVYKH